MGFDLNIYMSFAFRVLGFRVFRVYSDTGLRGSAVVATRRLTSLIDYTPPALDSLAI